MNKASTSLLGLTRHTDNGISGDGECLELINARVSNGSIEPVGRPILERTFSKTPIFIHKNGEYEHYITYSGNKVYYQCDKKDGEYIEKNILVCTLSGLEKIQSIGNILILSADSSISYAIFIEGEYKYLGEKPDMPKVSFYLKQDSSVKYSDSVWCDIDPRIKLSESNEIALNENSKDLVSSSFRGSVAKYLSALEEDKKFIYPILVRYAIRLYDGSYIMHSQPILLSPSDYMSVVVESRSIDNNCLTNFTYKIACKPSSIQVYQSFNLGDWKNIIQSIDVFATRRIVTDDMDSDITSFYYRQGNLTFTLPKFSTQDIKRKIEESSQFYLVKSIPVDGSLEDKTLFENASDIKNLEQKEVLPLDSYSHNTFGGEIYAYNSRLHVGNVKMKHCSPLPLSSQILIENGSGQIEVAHTLKQEVHIKTDSGIKIVHGEESFYKRDFSPYMAYPDSRAFKLVLYLETGGYKVFSLKAHPYLNLAYSLDQLKPYTFNTEQGETSDFTSGTYTPEAENSIEVSPSKIKVSSVSNPFYFPAKQTYTVSNMGVIGMASATTALSTGQFGQFPLYVFSEDGIYALSVGDGDIAYSNSFPINRSVCKSAKGIVSIDNAVIFPSSDGLMILQGSSVDKLSGKIEGYLSSIVDSSPVVKKVAKISGMDGKLSSTEFVYFLENSTIGYNYEDKEVVVSSKNYGYSYVYNFTSGEWHKIDVTVESFLNSYPECFAYYKGGVYNMHNAHRTINNILIVTRPVKFGTITHKRVLQSALRGVVRPSLSDIYLRGESVMFRGESIDIFSDCGFYILGSNDAEHFTLLAGREKIVDVRDLITKMNKTHAYKYFIYCLAGGVRTDVAFNYIESLIDETYVNRLR